MCGTLQCLFAPQGGPSPTVQRNTALLDSMGTVVWEHPSQEKTCLDNDAEAQGDGNYNINRVRK